MPTFTAGQILTAAQEGALAPLSAVKLSDNAAVNNSTVFVNDADLFLPVAASTTYEMMCVVRFSANNTANIKFGWTFPTGLTMKFHELLVGTGGAFGMFAIDQASAIAAQGTSGAAAFFGTVTVAATAGTLQLQFAQNTANVSNTFTQAGSYLRLTQLSP